MLRENICMCDLNLRWMDKMGKEENNERIEGKGFKLRYVQGKVVLIEYKTMISNI